MKKALLLTAVLVIGLAGCVTCAAPTDKATCDTEQAIAIANAMDIGFQAALLAAPVLPPSVVGWINIYHEKLPAAEKLLRDTLAGYEAGTIKDYKSVLQALVSLYTDINGMITAAGQPDVLAPAQAQARAALKTKGLVK